jgi:precorrin-6B methylase 2
MQLLTLDKLSKKVLESIDIQTAFKVSRCISAAEKLQLFRKLDGKAWTSEQIGKKVGIHPKFREIFLGVLEGLGLLIKKNGRYSLSRMCREYFIEQRSMYWTRLFSQYCIDDYIAMATLEKSLTTGKDYREFTKIKRKNDYELLRDDAGWAHDFTYLLYNVKKDESRILAKNLDLTNVKTLLDIGGGSGVMSIALLRKYKHLKACVMDFKTVCRTTKEIIKKERLTRRLTTYVGDLNKKIPKGYDALLIWDFGRIQKKAINNAYKSLDEGGMIIIGGYLAERKKLSLNALTRRLSGVYPDLQSWRETMDMLKTAGFHRVKKKRIDSDLWIITGVK